MPRMPSIRLKHRPPFGSVGRRRIIIGVLVGIGFAASLHMGSVMVGRATFAIMQARPEEKVESIRLSNETAHEWGLLELPVPELVGPAEAGVPSWFELIWAGLAAAFGHSLALYVWFPSAVPPWSTRAKKAAVHAHLGVTTGLMWIGLVLLFLVKLWQLYAVLVYGGNVWASAFGDPVAGDPFVPFFPFGGVAVLLVIMLVLEPWRGLQVAYRCGWWPAAALAVTMAVGALLYLVFRSVGVGAA